MKKLAWPVATMFAAFQKNLCSPIQHGLLSLKTTHRLKAVCNLEKCSDKYTSWHQRRSRSEFELTKIISTWLYLLSWLECVVVSFLETDNIITRYSVFEQFLSTVASQEMFWMTQMMMWLLNESNRLERRHKSNLNLIDCFCLTMWKMRNHLFGICNDCKCIA